MKKKAESIMDLINLEYIFVLSGARIACRIFRLGVAELWRSFFVVWIGETRRSETRRKIGIELRELRCVQRRS